MPADDLMNVNGMCHYAYWGRMEYTQISMEFNCQ